MHVIWSASQIQGGRDYQEDFFGIVENANVHTLNSNHNVDASILPSHQSLYLLADGMGGMGHGDIAASMVVEQFMAGFLANIKDKVELKTNLRSTLTEVNHSLEQLINTQPELAGMGCTLIAVLWDSQKETLSWLSVGDSVIAIQRGGQWTELNEKHIWRNLARQQQQMTEGISEQAEQNGDALYSAVDGSDIAAVDIAEITVQANDVIIIASDGLEVLPANELEHIVQSTITTTTINTEISAAFNYIDQIRLDLFAGISRQDNDYQDNTTVIVLGFFAQLA